MKDPPSRFKGLKDMSVKSCTKCGENKPFSEFYIKSRQELYPDTAAGVSAQCKVCTRAHRARYVKANPNAIKNAELKMHYNISLDEYLRMFNMQDGRCAICNIPQDQLIKTLAVDHNHNTGQIRALLCSACNVGLGMFKDQTLLLKKAISYLNHFSGLAAHTNMVTNSPEKAG